MNDTNKDFIPNKFYNDNNELGVIINNDIFPLSNTLLPLSKSNSFMYDEDLIRMVEDGSIKNMSSRDLDNFMINKNYISQEDFDELFNDGSLYCEGIYTGLCFNLDSFYGAKVVWIPKGTLYKICSNDMQEWIEYYDPKLYTVA